MPAAIGSGGGFKGGGTAGVGAIPHGGTVPPLYMYLKKEKKEKTSAQLIFP